MPTRRRAGPARAARRHRTVYLAHRIGVGLRESRLSHRITQADAGRRAGVSQPFWSKLERGASTTVALETLASCAAAVGLQLAAFLEAVAGADLPRDIEHLRRQQLVIAYAAGGGWTAKPERAIDTSADRSRSIDVQLQREARQEIAVVEIEDLLADGGHAMRGLADKVAAIRREFGGLAPEVRGLVILRATKRNRAMVRELRDLFATRFPGSSDAWLAALRDPSVAMPRGDGFAWSSVDGTPLFPARLHRA